MRRSIVSIVVVSAVVMGGCGRLDALGGHKTSKPLTKAAFIAEAEGRCAGATAKMRELGVQSVDAAPPGGDVARLRSALLAKREGYLEVSDLPPPKADEAVVTAFVNAAVDAVDQTIDRSRAIERGDTLADVTARDRATASLTKARKLGATLGLSACLP